MTTSKIRDAEEKVIAYAREKAEAIPLGHFKYLIDALDAARAEEPKAGLPSLADLTGGIDEARIRKIAREEALVRFKNVWDRLTELERRSSADAERIAALESKAITHDPDAKPGDCYTTSQPIERDTYDPPITESAMTDQPDRARLRALEMARAAIEDEAQDLRDLEAIDEGDAASVALRYRRADRERIRLTREPVLARALIEAEAEVERLRKWLVHFSRENLAGDPSRWTTLTSLKLHAALRGDPAPPLHNALTGEPTP